VNQVGALEPLLTDRAEAKMRKQKKPAANVAPAAEQATAVHPMDAKQAISESQSEPKFQENYERLKAERLAREAKTERPKKSEQ
jgi:hypothetical protein